MFQRIDHPHPKDAAALVGRELSGGAAGLTIVLAGSTAARSFGVRCGTPDDLLALLAPVDLDTAALRFEFSGADVDATRGRVLDAAKACGIAADHPKLDLSMDPLATASGEQRRDGAAGTRALRTAVGRSASWLADTGTRGALLHVDGRPHHEAGASDAQELAAALSAGVLGLRALEEVGLLDRPHPIRFTLAAGADQTLTIAKFRAFRRLWARVQHACGLQPEPVRVHAETAWRILARRDPWTNLVRNAVACAAAILGGADSVTVLPFTSALGLPDAFARRCARNTPLVLLEEAHLGRVADPAAGAGALDGLADGLCYAAWAVFQRLEAAGGAAEAMASGAWPRQVQEVAALRRAALEDGSAKLVGVTAFAAAAGDLPRVLMPVDTASGTVEGAGILPSHRDAEPFDEADPASPDPFAPGQAIP